jgi:hypothetical protein
LGVQSWYQGRKIFLEVCFLSETVKTELKVYLSGGGTKKLNEQDLNN